MKPTKVIYIHFNDKSRKQQDYFFGSMTAVYSTLTEEELGVKYRSLLGALSPSGTYRNPNISVVVGELTRNDRPNRRKKNEAE